MAGPRLDRGWILLREVAMAKKAESRSRKKPHFVADGIVPRHSLLLKNSFLLNMPGAEIIVSRNREPIPRPALNVVI